MGYPLSKTIITIEMFYYLQVALIYIYSDSNSAGKMFYHFKIIKYFLKFSLKAIRAEALKT